MALAEAQVVILYLFIYLFLRVRSPDQTILDKEVEHGPKVSKFTVDEHFGYRNFE